MSKKADDTKTGDKPTEKPDEKKPDTTTATGNEPPATEPPAKTLTQADIDAAVKKAQKEWEKAREAADAKAKLSEDERIKAENDDLKRQLQMTNAEKSVLAELEKAGAKSAKLLFDAKKNDLQFDDKGALSNLSDIIDELKFDYADMFGVEKPAESIDAGAGTTGKNQPLTKEAIEKMSVEEIIARESEVNEFLKSL